MTKIMLPLPETLTVSGQAAEKLIKAGDGDAALLYLHILATRGGKNDAETAEELRRTVADVRRAMRVLAKLGLVLLEDEAEPEPERPAQAAAVRTVRAPVDAKNGGAFSFIARETQNVLGKPLSSDDLERLLGIYDKLKLPPDVMLQLVHHCADETRRERGENRRPTMRYIEKAAYAWERNGIFTLDRAEKYIQEREERRSAVGEVKNALRIADRELSPSERQYIETWLSLGFPPDSVAIAYDRTVLKTGRLTWKYMDAIISDWHGKNLHAPDEILTRDVRSTAKTAAANAAPKQTAPTSGDIERMNRMLERMEQEDK